MIEKGDSGDAKKTLNDLLVKRHIEGEIRSFPALDTVLYSMEAVVGVQIRIQGSFHPTIHLAIPLLLWCIDDCRRVGDGGSVLLSEERG